MEFGILHIGTSLSLGGLLGMVFYFAYWKGRMDSSIDWIKQRGVNDSNQLAQIFSKLNEIKNSVGQLNTHQAHTERRLAKLEERIGGRG